MRKFNTYMRKAVIPNGIVLSTNNFYNMFNNMTYLNTIQFDHPTTTNISCMCYNCRNLVNLYICTNNVIDMSNAY